MAVLCLDSSTLEDLRAKVLAPDRLNSLVFRVFAAVALAIAVVGVAGVLGFSVSAHTREFAILALGSPPENLLRSVVSEGAIMAAAGIFAGAVFGFVAARVAGSYFGDLKMTGALPVIVSAFVLLAAAVPPAATWIFFQSVIRIRFAALPILENEEKQQQEAVASAKDSLQLFTNRYKGGVDTYLQAITAATTELANERNAIDIQPRRMDASVLLIKALGGGWDSSNLARFGSATVRDY